MEHYCFRTPTTLTLVHTLTPALILLTHTLTLAVASALTLTPALIIWCAHNQVYIYKIRSSISLPGGFVL